MLKKEVQLKKRDLYLKRLIDFKDTELVKVITGIRRCGKSSLLKLMVQYLRENGVESGQIIQMNFESFEYQKMTAADVYQYVKERLHGDKRTYLFFDEIQRISDWQDMINSFRVDFDCDIYVTGSNAYLLSSEYATYLAGRCIEIKMLPLSFREFLDFHGYEVREKQSPTGEVRKRLYDAEGENYDPKELLEAYMKFGGMPGIVDIGLRNYLLGFRDVDIGHCMENIVYFELLRRGYGVAIGKIAEKEVDFIATNAREKIYFQVTESMNAPSTRERELAPLQKIRDNYEKVVLAGECDNPVTQEGIKIVKLTDFLLED